VVSGFNLEENIKLILEERYILWIGLIWLKIGGTSGVS
jgi:hypothetical protein